MYVNLKQALDLFIFFYPSKAYKQASTMLFFVCFANSYKCWQILLKKLYICQLETQIALLLEKEKLLIKITEHPIYGQRKRKLPAHKSNCKLIKVYQKSRMRSSSEESLLTNPSDSLFHPLLFNII